MREKKKKKKKKYIILSNIGNMETSLTTPEPWTYSGGTAWLIVDKDAHVQARVSLKKTWIETRITRHVDEITRVMIFRDRKMQGGGREDSSRMHNYSAYRSWIYPAAARTSGPRAAERRSESSLPASCESERKSKS